MCRGNVLHHAGNMRARHIVKSAAEYVAFFNVRGPVIKDFVPRCGAVLSTQEA